LITSFYDDGSTTCTTNILGSATNANDGTSFGYSGESASGSLDCYQGVIGSTT